MSLNMRDSELVISLLQFNLDYYLRLKNHTMKRKLLLLLPMLILPFFYRL